MASGRKAESLRLPDSFNRSGVLAMLREVKCPRCTLSWYSDEDGGKQRLCPTCIEHLRKERDKKQEWDFSSLWQGWYAIPTLSAGAALLLLFLLSLAWPKVFGVVLGVVAVVVLLAGLVGVRLAKYGRRSQGEWVQRGVYDPVGSRDQDLGGWSFVAILMALSAIGLAVAYVGRR
jgi:hypothetical protein